MQEDALPNLGQRQTLEFAGDRHSLLVSLYPELAASIPDNSWRTFDLHMFNEAGYSASVMGNGRRCIGFVGLGGSEMFEKLCSRKGGEDVAAAFPEAGVYFSPRLTADQCVEGAVLLARVERGENEELVGFARILLEKIEAARITLRLSIGPAWGSLVGRCSGHRSELWQSCA